MPMKIAELLREEMVIPRLSGESKEEILAELTQAVAAGYSEIAPADLLEVLREREKLGSTAIGEGIAIPHGKLPTVKRVIGAFGRKPEGVNFDSLDGQPTRLFFLLVAPEDSAGAHLKALARVSRVLKSEELRGRVLAADSRAEIYRAILEEDGKY